jgi:hypothetical protein
MENRPSKSPGEYSCREGGRSWQADAGLTLFRSFGEMNSQFRRNEFAVFLDSSRFVLSGGLARDM